MCGLQAVNEHCSLCIAVAASSSFSLGCLDEWPRCGMSDAPLSAHRHSAHVEIAHVSATKKGFIFITKYLIFKGSRDGVLVGIWEALRMYFDTDLI